MAVLQSVELRVEATMVLTELRPTIRTASDAKKLAGECMQVLR